MPFVFDAMQSAIRARTFPKLSIKKKRKKKKFVFTTYISDGDLNAYSRHFFLKNYKDALQLEAESDADYFEDIFYH